MLRRERIILIVVLFAFIAIGTLIVRDIINDIGGEDSPPPQTSAVAEQSPTTAEGGGDDVGSNPTPPVIDDTNEEGEPNTELPQEEIPEVEFTEDGEILDPSSVVQALTDKKLEPEKKRPPKAVAANAGYVNWRDLKQVEEAARESAWKIITFDKTNLAPLQDDLSPYMSEEALLQTGQLVQGDTVGEGGIVIRKPYLSSMIMRNDGQTGARIVVVNFTRVYNKDRQSGSLEFEFSPTRAQITQWRFIG